jgi:predicted CoA-binding protein
MTHTSDESLRELLAAAKTIAVVGLSDSVWRTSYGVSQYMQSQGYRIIPVNPNIESSLGEHAYSSLEEVPDEYEIVNVFRRSEFVGDLVSAVIASRANYVWMQLGVVDEQAARLMAEAGKTVVMDRCILQDHQRLIGRR